MLRLIYADQGTKQDLLAAIRAARGWAEQRFADGQEQVRGYLALLEELVNRPLSGHAAEQGSSARQYGEASRGLTGSA